MYKKSAFISYCCLYVVAFCVLPRQGTLFFIYALKNVRDIVWLASLNFTLFVQGIWLKYFLISALFLFIYPFVALFDPLWREKYGLTGELYELPLILERDRQNNYKVSKNVQSKLFWHGILNQYDIATPDVYWHNGTQIAGIRYHNQIFIEKPEYGTEGAHIKKVSLEEYKKNNYMYSVLLQEFLEDCNSKFARAVRIFTYCENQKAKKYYKHILYTQTTNDPRTHLHHKAIKTSCDYHNCKELSPTETQYLKVLTPKLCTLHEKELYIIPIIAWDLILTCNDAYVLEGNMCPAKLMEDGELLKMFKSDLSRQFSQ